MRTEDSDCELIDETIDTLRVGVLTPRLPTYLVARVQDFDQFVMLYGV